jgi:VWFA-related protein
LLPLLAAVFSPAGATAGQVAGEKEITTQEVQSPFKVQAQRNMVLVRVVVRDSNGHPVSGLRKEDFRLFDNGKPQDIDQFAVETSSRTSPAVPPAPSKEPEEEAASEPATANLTPRNYQALYFDDVQMKFEDIAHARDAADRYLAATLTAADRAAIFTSSGQGNLDFTDDRSKLHEALFKLRPTGFITEGTFSCLDIGAYQAYLIAEIRDANATEIATVEAAQCVASSQVASLVQAEALRVWEAWQAQSRGVLRGLEQVVRRTALLPGQHSVIFISPGFLLYNLESEVAEIADRALRSNVVISALDPRGLYVVIPGGDATQPNNNFLPSAVALLAGKQQLIEQDISLSKGVLSDFAADTGGQFFQNSNDLDQGFRQVGMLSDVYYVLAFSPRNLKFDGRFHKLKVSLANPAGFTLQARHGYFAPKASEDAATRAEEDIEQAIYSQDELRELPVDVHTRFFKLDQSETRLAVLAHLDVTALRFRKQQDRNVDDLIFATALFDRDGKFVLGTEKRFELRLLDSTLARLAQTGITVKAEFDLKPGTYLVRQIVRDSQAGQLSELNHTVEIPY